MEQKGISQSSKGIKKEKKIDPKKRTCCGKFFRESKIQIDKTKMKCGNIFSSIGYYLRRGFSAITFQKFEELPLHPKKSDAQIEDEKEEGEKSPLLNLED